MHFGKPYKYVPPPSNTPPGTYDSNISYVLPKRQAPKFGQSEKGDRLGRGSFLISPIKDNPTGGNYQKPKGEFGKLPNKITFFGKHKEEKIDETPAPGTYNIEKSVNFVKPKVQTLGWRKPKLYKVAY